MLVGGVVVRNVDVESMFTVAVGERVAGTIVVALLVLASVVVEATSCVELMIVVVEAWIDGNSLSQRLLW